MALCIDSSMLLKASSVELGVNGLINDKIPVFFHCPAVHTIAHLLNVEWFIGSRHGLYGPLASNLSMLEDEQEDNTTFLNPIQSDSTVYLTT